MKSQFLSHVRHFQVHVFCLCYCHTCRNKQMISILFILNSKKVEKLQRFCVVEDLACTLSTFTVLSTEPENILPRDTAKQATLPWCLSSV